MHGGLKDYSVFVSNTLSTSRKTENKKVKQLLFCFLFNILNSGEKNGKKI